jgi:hypothetical protein
MANLLNSKRALELANQLNELLAEWRRLTQPQLDMLKDWNIDADCMEWHIESVRDVYSRIEYRSEKLLEALKEE